MEGDRIRRLTTLAVACCLTAGVASFVAGVALGLARPPPPDARVLSYTALLAGAWPASAVAWISLGALFFILVPTVRMLGMAATFWAEGERRALLSSAVVLSFLVGALSLPLLVGPPGAEPATGTESPPGAKDERGEDLQGDDQGR